VNHFSSREPRPPEFFFISVNPEGLWTPLSPSLSRWLSLHLVPFLDLDCSLKFWRTSCPVRFFASSYSLRPRRPFFSVGFISPPPGLSIRSTPCELPSIFFFFPFCLSPSVPSISLYCSQTDADMGLQLCGPFFSLFIAGSVHGLVLAHSFDVVSLSFFPCPPSVIFPIRTPL